MLVKQLSTILAAAGLASASASASTTTSASAAAATTPTPIVDRSTGFAHVINKCDFDVFLWTVGSNISEAHTLAAATGTYDEKYVRDPISGGRTIKITKEPRGIFNAKPEINFAYNLNEGRIWYDLNKIFANPFGSHHLRVDPSDFNPSASNVNCGSIAWEDGHQPETSQIKNCLPHTDVTLTLCAPRRID